MGNCLVFTWNGERNRPLRAYRPCTCNVCSRGRMGVGYISWSDADGQGFTVWIESEGIFHMMERALKKVDSANKGVHH